MGTNPQPMKYTYFSAGFPLVSLIFLVAGHQVHAQFIPFSQYQFQPALTNPALSSSSEYTQVALQYRRSGYSEYSHPALSLTHPLHTEAGRRYGGVSVTAIRESLGPGSAYAMSALFGGMSYRLSFSKHHHVAMGLQAAWVHKNVDPEMLRADALLAISRFDPTIMAGEQIINSSAHRVSLSVGGVWTWTDTDGRQKTSLGLAVYDLNQPRYHLQKRNTRSSRQYVVSATWLALERYRFTLTPMARIQHAHESGLAVKRDLGDLIYLGAEAAYTAGRQLDNELGATLLYTSYQSVMLGAHYKLPEWIFAASYDFRISTGYGDYTRKAIEFMVAWRVKSARGARYAG